MAEIKVESVRVPGLTHTWRVVRVADHVRIVLKSFESHDLAVAYAHNAALALATEATC